MIFSVSFNSFLMISDFAPEQVLFDLSKKTIKVNEQVSQTIFQLHGNAHGRKRKSSIC